MSEFENGGQVPQEKKKNRLGTTGFVLSIIALCLGWIPVVGWIIGGILWFLGLLFSFIGVFKTPRGLAIAGLIISLFWIILIFTVFGSALAAFS